MPSVTPMDLCRLKKNERDGVPFGMSVMYQASPIITNTPTATSQCSAMATLL